MCKLTPLNAALACVRNLWRARVACRAVLPLPPGAVRGNWGARLRKGARGEPRSPRMVLIGQLAYIQMEFSPPGGGDLGGAAQCTY